MKIKIIQSSLGWTI